MIYSVYRVLLYVDHELEDDSLLPLTADNREDVVKVGFTCDNFPLQQSYFSGTINSLTYHPNSAYKEQVAGEGNLRLGLKFLVGKFSLYCLNLE